MILACHFQPVTNHHPSPVNPDARIGIYKSGARGNMDEGWTRYVFDTFNVPYQSLTDSALREAEISNRFNVIVLPSERRLADTDDEDAAVGGLTASALDSLRGFVEKGGTLICFDGSCGPVIKQYKLPLRNVLEGLRSNEFYCPGSILRLEVDNAHPIARAMARQVDAYFINSSAFEQAIAIVRVVAPIP